MKLAVIPARGGSKRIPRKNIKLFGGKPMIAWSIEAAQGTKLFDRIIVSTDDEEIASVAKQYRAEVPFLRPAELSDHYTGTSPVIAHAIEWHTAHGFEPTQICCIYATAPFLQSIDIERGMKILEQSNADFAFSITSFAYPIQRAIKLTPDGRIEMFDQSKFQMRSQDLTEAYHDAGQFYWGTKDAWLSGIPIFGSNSAPVNLPRYRVQDIDTIEDWRQAELMMEVLKNH
ncbi:MAG: pseudaminic acid cytidylyltransferase [Pseudomonadota bacterium]|nr:pseudaminic acid cytidylyltransferase [Pseudomonadota bacterium]